MTREQEIALAGGLTVVNERTGRDAAAHLKVARTNRCGLRPCRSCGNEISPGDRFWYVTAFFAYELCLACGPTAPSEDEEA